MVTENQKQFVVGSYKEAFELYRNGEFGCIEQRMDDNLIEMVEGSDFQRIRSLLEEDFDNFYSVVEYKKVFIITLLGFSISKAIDENVDTYYLSYGEDGKWEEFLYNGDEEYSDATHKGFECWSEVELKHPRKMNEMAVETISLK